MIYTSTALGITVTELLERAADRIETKDWQTGNYGGNDGPNCVVGAVLREAEAASGGKYVSCNWVESLVRPGLPEGHQNPVHWNDYHCPDRAAAADVLRMAAKAAAKTMDLS